MKDANGKEHAPKGNSNGGQFIAQANAAKMREAVRKYSDTPAKDMESMGIARKQTLSDFVFRVKSRNARPGEIFEIGEITYRARHDIERLTGQKLNANKHVIDVDAIRHIENRHGKNGKADTSMSDIRDYEEMVDILKNYDHVDFARKANGEISYSQKYKDAQNHPAPHIVYTMKNGKTMYLLEAVTDTKKGVLHIVSAYKN